MRIKRVNELNNTEMYNSPHELLEYIENLELRLDIIKGRFSKMVSMKEDTTTFSINVDNLKSKLDSKIEKLDIIHNDIKGYMSEMDIDYIENPRKDDTQGDELYDTLENKANEIEIQREKLEEYVDLLDNLVKHLRNSDDLYTILSKFKF